MEEEQNGASRAEYGKHVIEVASAALTEEFGKGFSKTNIKSYRRYYNFFPDLGIGQAVPAQLEKQKQQAVPAIFIIKSIVYIMFRGAKIQKEKETGK